MVESAQEYAEHAGTVNELCERLGRTRPLLRHVQIFADALEPAAAREVVDRLASQGATTCALRALPEPRLIRDRSARKGRARMIPGPWRLSGTVSE